MNRIIPQKDIDAIEEARIKLYEFYEQYFVSNLDILIEIQKISEPMWYISHRKYKEAK